MSALSARLEQFSFSAKGLSQRQRQTSLRLPSPDSTFTRDGHRSFLNTHIGAHSRTVVGMYCREALL